MTNIADNILNVRQSIAEAEKSAGRKHGSVALLAVSKTRPSSDIRTAWENTGQTAFGENYLQEALEKIKELSDLPLEWHFIGAVQSNKTRPIAEHFAWMHTLSREKIARRLSEQRPDHLPPLKVCLQVNISQEESKNGASLADIPPLAKAIATLPNISLKGLMAIPSSRADETTLRGDYARLKDAFNQLQNEYPQMDTLSMGMSADMNVAIQSGSTMVRIGTAIFGKRDNRLNL